MSPDPKLGRALFALVEEDQGRAFISDGIENQTTQEIIALARGSLRRSRQVVRKLEAFIAKHAATGSREGA